MSVPNTGTPQVAKQFGNEKLTLANLLNQLKALETYRRELFIKWQKAKTKATRTAQSFGMDDDTGTENEVISEHSAGLFASMKSSEGGAADSGAKAAPVMGEEQSEQDADGATGKQTCLELYDMLNLMDMKQSKDFIADEDCDEHCDAEVLAEGKNAVTVVGDAGSQASQSFRLHAHFKDIVDDFCLKYRSRYQEDRTKKIFLGCACGALLLVLVVGCVAYNEATKERRESWEDLLGEDIPMDGAAGPGTEEGE